MSEDRYDEHYVNAVTALGDTHAVVTTQAIFTRKGIKLVEAGTRVDSGLRDRLVRHKLTPALDSCLAVEGGVTQAGLRDAARRLFEEEPRFQPLRAALPGVERLVRAFYAMPLVPSMAFKLTVARESRPELFEHSVRMALLALFLAVKSRCNDHDLAGIAAAAMFHDLGILHIDPALLQPGRVLSEAERRHLYAHPVTAYLILQEYPQYHPDISTAVFEHHERLDGSGYPRGLRGEEISLWGQILMLAEVVAKFFEPGARPEEVMRAALVLKLNQRKFSRQLIEHMVGPLRNADPQAGGVEAVSAESVLAQLDQLGEVLRDWGGLHAKCMVDQPEITRMPLIGFIQGRVAALERELAETGFDPNELAALTAGTEDDAVALAELQCLVRESRWQLAEIMREVRRRWAELAAGDGAGGALVEAWLARSEEALRD